MPKFRKKPVVIEAMQFKGHDPLHVDEVMAFDDWMVANQGDRKCRYAGNTVVIPTLEGDMTADPGDWIIRGITGELYPVKPDVFQQSYEAVNDEG